MTVEYVPYNLTEQQIAELWDGYAAGQSVARAPGDLIAEFEDPIRATRDGSLPGTSHRLDVRLDVQAEVEDAFYGRGEVGHQREVCDHEHPLTRGARPLRHHCHQAV